MYETFYGLSVSPFGLTPDPSFLVMTEAHCNAKAGLLYAILGGKGFTVLTGDAGTGKTTLLRSVINSIPADSMRFSMILNPALNPDDFIEMALNDFGLDPCKSKPDRLRGVQDFLLKVHQEGKRAVLFVDEAHRLSMETLEEIRLLSNFETDTRKLLQIVLAGQDEFDEVLDRQELRQLKQRIEVRLRVSPLSADGVGVYIAQRWAHAGTSQAPFSKDAIQVIAHVSKGIPRLINTVCNNALLIGFAEGAPEITVRHVLEACWDLHLTAEEKPTVHKNGNGTARTMALQVPLPESTHYNNNPLSLFANPKPKRAWWRRSKSNA